MPRRARHPGRTHRAAGGALVAALAVGGCGSAPVSERPPAAVPDRAQAVTQPPDGTIMATTPDSANRQATPARSATLRDGALRVSLDPRARTLRLEEPLGGAVVDEIPVGVGPAQVACATQGPCFVTDTTGDALLVVRVAEDGRSMRLSRRVYVAGAPYAIAIDPERRRLWVTLTARNELVELGAHGRPHILRRHPAVQQPDGVRVDPASGDVTVIGLDPPQLQRLVNPASPDRP